MDYLLIIFIGIIILLNFYILFKLCDNKESVYKHKKKRRYEDLEDRTDSLLKKPEEEYVQELPVREIYPIPVIPGEEYKNRYLVKPSGSGVISMRNVDHPYQDLTTSYTRIGTVSSASLTDDTVMSLYRRDIAPERDWYEYKVVDHSNGNNLDIFLTTNIVFLKNGQRIVIPGYESKGEFVVSLDRQYNYIRLNPFSS